MMLATLSVLVFGLSVANAIAVGNDDTDASCGEDYKKLEHCYLKQLYSEAEDKAVEYKESVSKCFSSRKGCHAPDFDHDPLSEMPRFFRKIAEKIKEDWANTSAAVKRCIRKNITEEVAAGLNRCLGRRGVHQFNVSQFAEIFANEDGSDIFGVFMHESGNNSRAERSWMAFLLGRLNIARAFRECDEKQGSSSNDKSKESLGHCAKRVFADAKAHFCNETTHCRKEAAAACKNRAEKVYQAVCDCKYEKVLDMIQHLDELRQRGNVTLSEMIHAMSAGENPRKYIQAVDDCYVKNGQKTPSIIRLLENLSKSADKSKNNKSETATKNKADEKQSGHDKAADDSDMYTGERDPMLSHAQPAVVDVSIINTIRDFLASQAFNKAECVPCPK